MMKAPRLSDAVRATLPPVIAAYLTALEAVVASLQAENAALRAEVEALQARLGQNSTNSSRPPSTDPPGRHPPPTPHGTRRPGGQPGHRGHFRALLPPERVDQVQRVVPAACGRCGQALAAPARPDDPADLRHQVTEVLLPRATVTEYRLAARRCGRCGHTTRAAWPVGVPAATVGPNLVALVGLLTGRYRLSKREVAQCLADLFGVDLSVGMVSAIEQAVSAALAPVVGEAATAVRQAAVANLDETGWREGRQRAWLWTMVTAAVTVFHIDRHRSGQVVRDLLGPDWTGIVGSDRYTAYKWLPVAGRAVCWSHLRRDFQKLVDYGPGPRPVGQRLVAIAAQVFALWHRFKAADLERGELIVAMGRVAADMRAVLEEGAVRGHAAAQPLCRALLAVWPALWTFVVVEGVEPTNNAAEQALRPAVLWRKGSFGTHSAPGSRFAERMLTVAATCRQQGRNLFAFLRAAATAAQYRLPPPSLLPAPVT